MGDCHLIEKIIIIFLSLSSSFAVLMLTSQNALHLHTSSKGVSKGMYNCKHAGNTAVMIEIFFQLEGSDGENMPQTDHDLILRQNINRTGRQ